MRKLITHGLSDITELQNTKWIKSLLDWRPGINDLQASFNHEGLIKSISDFFCLD